MCVNYLTPKFKYSCWYSEFPMCHVVSSYNLIEVFNLVVILA